MKATDQRDAPRVAGTGRLTALELEPASWLPEAHRLYQDGWWFEGLWGEGGPGAEVQALWGRTGEALLLRLACPTKTFPSLTRLIPASDWFERALRDRTGLGPIAHVDPRPFLFHETYPAGHVEGASFARALEPLSAEYPFLHHEGPGVFEIPVGPIHAGIIEPGHFRFTTVGEVILDLEVRLNYTHKGVFALARGRPVEHALRLLERLSGDNAVSHALAFASACEAASALEVPDAVQAVRTALVELERLYNHCGDLAGIAVDVAYAAGAAQLQALREELMRWNQRLVGHRLLMNAVSVGGLHVAPEAAAWDAFVADLDRLRRRFEEAVQVTFGNSGLKERIEGTGMLSTSNAELLGCVGPTARASGISRDARADAPCLAYPQLGWRAVTRREGTVAARAWVKIEEVRASLDLLSRPISLPPSTPPALVSTPGVSEGVAQVEASRGAVLSWVRLHDGLVKDVFQRDPSFLNWRAVEQAVLRNIVPDFPLINKSFNLSYAGSDA